MERSKNKVKDIVVIGAGVGGLATSIRLAKKGHKVSIYEAGDFIGGKCHSIVREGFTFDTGPNLLTIPAVYRDLFMKSGKRLEHILELKSVDPAFAYNFSDGKVLKLSNLSVKNNCDEIESVFGKGAGDEWHNLMQRAERMWDLSRGPFIESELRIKNILKELSFSKLIAISPFISLRKYVSRYTKNKYLRMIIDRYATYSGSDPRKAPAPILTIPFIESAFGAWHITGGIGKLSEKLGERAQEIGVRIHLNSPVEKIILKDGRAAGIKLKSGEEIISDLVVSNVDANLLYEKLIPTNFKGARRERRKLKNLTPSFSGFSLFIGLDNSKISGPVPKLEHHNIYFPDDYDEEFKSLFDMNIPVDDPTIYISAPKDLSLVPNERCESWSVLVNAPLHNPKSGVDWNLIEEEYAQKILNRLEELGLKVKDRLAYFEYRSPRNLAIEVNAPGGSIYGTSSNGFLAPFKRPQNRSDIPGLYLVGGSTHPGGGLPLVGISAEIVAEAIG